MLARASGRLGGNGGASQDGTPRMAEISAHIVQSPAQVFVSQGFHFIESVEQTIAFIFHGSIACGQIDR